MANCDFLLKKFSVPWFDPTIFWKRVDAFGYALSNETTIKVTYPADTTNMSYPRGPCLLKMVYSTSSKILDDRTFLIPWKDGPSLILSMVKTHCYKPYGSWENVNLLKSIAQQGAPNVAI
jgi:hypothetical protein